MWLVEFLCGLTLLVLYTKHTIIRLLAEIRMYEAKENNANRREGKWRLIVACVLIVSYLLYYIASKSSC